MPLRNTPPRPHLDCDQPLLLAPRNPARAQPIHSLHRHRACPLLPTSPHATWTAATPSFAPRVGGATSVHPHACTCPSQAGGQRNRRRRRAGPQGGRPQRPRAVPLARGPAWCSMIGGVGLLLRTARTWSGVLCSPTLRAAWLADGRSGHLLGLRCRLGSELGCGPGGQCGYSIMQVFSFTIWTQT